jgi:hypothetical protein
MVAGFPDVRDSKWIPGPVCFPEISACQEEKEEIVAGLACVLGILIHQRLPFPLPAVTSILHSRHVSE